MFDFEIGDKIEWTQGGKYKRTGIVIYIFPDKQWVRVKTEFKTVPEIDVSVRCNPHKINSKEGGENETE